MSLPYLFSFHLFSNWGQFVPQVSYRQAVRMHHSRFPSQSIRDFVCLDFGFDCCFLVLSLSIAAHKTQPIQIVFKKPCLSITSKMTKGRRFEAIVQSWRESNRVDRLNCSSSNGEDARWKKRTNKHSMRLTTWLQNQKHALVQQEGDSEIKSYDQPTFKSIHTKATLLGNANDERRDETDNVTSSAKSR
jgi:hypothetical protein